MVATGQLPGATSEDVQSINPEPGLQIPKGQHEMGKPGWKELPRGLLREQLRRGTAAKLLVCEPVLLGGALALLAHLP